MRKLAYEGIGTDMFEMPVLRKVNLEKENNIVFATPKTVYRGSSGGTYTRDSSVVLAVASELRGGQES